LKDNETDFLIAVHLKDLHSVLEQNPIVVEDQGHPLINFQRYVKFMDRIKEILHYKPPVLEQYRHQGQLAYLENQLKGVQLTASTDDELMEKSIALEAGEVLDFKLRRREFRSLGFETGNIAVPYFNQEKYDKAVELQPLHYQSLSPADPIYLHSHLPCPNQSYPKFVHSTMDNQNAAPHPPSMSSKPQAFPYAQSVFSPDTMQDTSKTVKFTPSLKLHTQDKAKEPTDESVIGKHFVIGAESVLEGIQEKETVIQTAFADFQIFRSEYAVLAGFNEALMRSGTGYLPEIHIFCSVDIVERAESFVTKLGKILSPLPGALFTPSSMYRIPVFKNDETLLSWEELVFSRTEGYADICSAVAPPTSIQVVSCPQGSWRNGGTSAPSGFSENELKGSDSDDKDTDNAGNEEGEDEKSGGREGDDGNPDDEDPDDPTDGSLTFLLPVVSFDAQAKVYANTADTVSPKVLQRLQVNGRLIIQVSCLLFSRPEDFNASKSLMLHAQNQNDSQRHA